MSVTKNAPDLVATASEKGTPTQRTRRSNSDPTKTTRLQAEGTRGFGATRLRRDSPPRGRERDPEPYIQSRYVPLRLDGRCRQLRDERTGQYRHDTGSGARLLHERGTNRGTRARDSLCMSGRLGTAWPASRTSRTELA